MKKGYKQTKVGVVPEDWEVASIDSVLQRVRKKVDVNLTEEYQQIGIRSHAKGIFHKELVTGEVLGNKSVFWIEEDCFIVNIVFAWEQAVAKTTKNERGMIASHRFPMYQPKDNKVLIDYILYFFKSKRGKYLLGLASPGGAGRNKTLGQKEFSELKIPLPSLQEQEKIVEILSTWDEAIAKQETLIKAKEQQKKGFMQKLLSGEVRFDGFDDEWKEVKLGNVTNIKTGKRDLQDKKTNGIYPFFVRSKNIERINSYSYDGEAILIPGDGQIGRVYHYVNCKFDYHQRVYKISDSINSSLKYIYYSLQKYFYKHAMSFSVKATVDSLRLPIIKNFKIKLPSLQEQQRIVEMLSNADNETELLINELEVLKQQRKGLIQKLLIGEMKVKV